MKLTVNGDAMDLEDGATAAALLEPPPRPAAIGILFFILMQTPFRI